MLFSRAARFPILAALLALALLQPAQARERYTVAWTLYAGQPAPGRQWYLASSAK